MWVWHIPALYDGALESPFVHVARALRVLDRRRPVLVAPLLADPPAPSPHGARARRYMASTKVFVGLLGSC
jgi:hypothetical protein